MFSDIGLSSSHIGKVFTLMCEELSPGLYGSNDLVLFQVVGSPEKRMKRSTCWISTRQTCCSSGTSGFMETQLSKCPRPSSTRACQLQNITCNPSYLKKTRLREHTGKTQPVASQRIKPFLMPDSTASQDKHTVQRVTQWIRAAD